MHPVDHERDQVQPGFFLWYYLVTVVPCLLGSSLADAQHLPHGRRQVGDRHLKFHESRDNLPARKQA